MLHVAIPAAMEMAEFASAAIGGPVANDPHGNIWAFPDPESRDLAGRIFGPVRTTLSKKWPNNYQYIKTSGSQISHTVQYQPRQVVLLVGRQAFKHYRQTNRHDYISLFNITAPDSWAYFGIGAQQLTQGNRINHDGSMSDIGWTVNLYGSVANNLLVNLTDWTLAHKLRTRDSASSKPAASRKLLKGRINRQVRGTTADLSKKPLTMASNATYINNSSIYGTPLPSEEVQGPQLTSYSSASASDGLTSSTPLSLLWKNSSSSTFPPNTGSSAPYLLSLWYLNTTTSGGSHILPTSSVFFAFIQLPDPTASTIALLSTVRSPSTSTTMINPDAFDNSTSTNTTSAITYVGKSFMPTSGYLSDFTTTFTKSGDFITVIKSSKLVISAYSSPSLFLCTTTDEVDKIWCQVSITPKPTATFNNPDPKGTDDIEIPFVKVTIPDGPCEPLPKVHHGGFFGALFNLGSDLVDGVLDDPCHLVFPIVKGVKLPLPEWLVLNIYPPQESFPDSLEEEKSSTIFTSFITTSFSSSKLSISTTASSSSLTSSICSASAVSSCVASCAVSAGSTQSCSTICSTVTACSGTATTSSTISSINTSENGSWEIHQVPTNFINIQSSIQSVLVAAWASAPKGSDASSYASVQSSVSTAKSTKSGFGNTQDSSFSSTSSRITFISGSESERSSTFQTSGLSSLLSSHATVTTSSSQSNTSPISSVSNTLSKSSVLSSTIQFSVFRSGNSGKTSSSTTSSPPSIFSDAPTRSSTIGILSNHIASTTIPAIESTTPIDMFQMNFWYQTDNKEKSTGNLWYMYVNKLVDRNLSHVDLCQTSGLVSVQDQNIASHDPLPSPIPYPGGSFALPPKGAGAGCYFKGDRSVVGDVFCPGKPTVSCQGNAGEAPIVCD
ncbi:hypothetical protein BHYA_0084g00020 [Botrytis hyacinthi]|uniref:Uncharacterized protein n=1 Tax=Botrytis hyacinthi TaxID=278943 RepID=A0A4Z1GRA6_9HELO|nr:hypothetical protein BHYA_0084g00020 [Botrytis hyacinthi]